MAIESVSALVLDRLAVFEFGVICEVFGIDRSADGVPNFDFKVCGPEAGKPLRDEPRIGVILGEPVHMMIQRPQAAGGHDASLV